MLPNSEEVSSSGRQCQICSQETNGCHFGVDACRACAAFFRRSIVDKKTYYCRNGGNCVIDKSIRCLCRKCRLVKCLDAGMQMTGVQGKREDEPLTSASCLEVQENTARPENREEPRHLLTILKNHTELCSIRKATERALDPESYKTMETGGILAGMSPGTSRNWSVFFRSQIPTVVEFVTKCFDEVQELSEEERWLLLKPFIVYIWWVDSAFRTYKRIPREQFTTLALMSETTYFDVNRCEVWFEKDTIPEFLKQDLTKFVKKEMGADRQRSIFLMSDIQVRDVEYAALVGLLFWNSTVEECSDRIHEVIRRGRARIYNELGLYYKQQREFSAAVRIGELLNIQSAVMVETIRCREDLEIYKLFDAFDKDDYFAQMIRNIYKCQICSESCNGTRFGVDSCRACSEFFRRSVADRKQYTCNERNSCLVHKSIRRPCRSCRLRKCLDKGMQISGVYVTAKELESLSEIEVISACSSQKDNDRLHLETVWMNYQALCSVRAETEKRLDPEGYKTANESGLLKGLYHGTPKIWSLFQRAHTPSVVEFVSKSIQGYHDLSQDEREILLRPFLVYFWWMEGLFRVYKRAPKELYTSLFLVSDISYMDVSRKDKLFEGKDIPPLVVKDLMSLLKREMKADRQRSAFLMHGIQLRDCEFVALAELLFWNSTVENCSEELHKKIRRGRARVMDALDRYYAGIGEKETFVRIGEILNIQNATFIEIFRCREDMESFKIFDAFDSFDFVYKVIKDV